MSMIGNVWQMTDEYADGHTRSVILRGGSNYRPSGSGWYLPPTMRITSAGRLSAVNG